MLQPQEKVGLSAASSAGASVVPPRHLSPAGSEATTVLLMSLGFGLVGVDRFVVLPLFPSMQKDLGLSYEDLGTMASVFSLAWGLAAVLAGRLSDRVGRVRTLVPTVAIFSLLAGLSGVTTGLASLLMVRALMGLSEGAFTPVAIATTIEASAMTRRGLNLGLQQNLYAVLGLGLTPIVATQLLQVLPSWRGVFLIVSLPGLVLAFAIHRLLRQGPRQDDATLHAGGQGAWAVVFGHRNVPLSMAGMCCMLTALLVTTTMAPSYLTDIQHLPIVRMGFVMSGFGWGGFVGQLILPGISDRLGRKPVVLFCYLAAMVALAAFLRAGASPMPLFLALFFVSFCINSMICLNVGPLTVEAVPAAFAATASGAVVGCGELLGGGFAPGAAGYVAQHQGLAAAFLLAFGGLALGAVAALFLEETAPLLLARRARRITA